MLCSGDTVLALQAEKKASPRYRLSSSDAAVAVHGQVSISCY